MKTSSEPPGAIAPLEPFLRNFPLQQAETVAEALKMRGYGYVQFVPPPGLIENIIRGWGEFLALPWEERMRWQVGDPSDWDDGYVPRIPNVKKEQCAECPGCAMPEGGTEHDKKHFFHFRPHLPALLDHAKTDYSAHLKWLNDLSALYELCTRTFHEVLVDLDRLFPEFDFAGRFSSLTAKTRHVVRLLSYDMPMQPGQELGKDHFDRNFGTFQVHETHPGLVLNLPEGRKDYVARPGQVLMFTSAKASKLTQKGLQAINHGIYVPKDFVPQAEVVPRRSIVFFGHVWPDDPAMPF